MEVNMGERYYITGVQLGVLVALPDKKDRKRIACEIIEKQYLGNTKSIKKKS